MDFKYNLKKAIADTAQTVAQKTGELVECSKTKYSIYDLNNEIEKVYTDLGRKIYECYKEDEDASEFVSEKCAEIDSLNEKLDILKEKCDSGQ